MRIQNDPFAITPINILIKTMPETKAERCPTNSLSAGLDIGPRILNQPHTAVTRQLNLLMFDPWQTREREDTSPSSNSNTSSSGIRKVTREFLLTSVVDVGIVCMCVSDLTYMYTRTHTTEIGMSRTTTSIRTTGGDGTGAACWLLLLP